MDINDPNDMFSENRDEMLINKLTEKFVGTCYNSCFIIKINKIIRRSYIYMKDTLDGDSQSSIMFEVDALVYLKNEILNGCTIVKKEPNGVIHAKSEYGGIQINITRNLDIFKEQDVVPVIVRRVGYNINQPEITIKASPFIPMNEPLIYYRSTGVLTDNQIENISEIIKQINANESALLKLSANNKKIIKFFVNLLNEKSQINKKLGKIEKISMTDIKHLSDIKSRIIVRENSFSDNTISLIESDASSEISMVVNNKDESNKDESNKDESNKDESNKDESNKDESNKDESKKDESNKDESKKDESDFIVEESIYNIYSSILLQYLGNLQSLSDFLKHYPTFESVQKNKSIWKIYNMLKK
jgi:hypothetical protein